MLKKINLVNYRLFNKLELDLSKTKQEVSKVVVIYGENGAGKTTIISAIHFLQNTLVTLLHQESFNEFIESKKFEDIDKEQLYDFLRDRHFFLEHEIKKNKKIDSKDNMVLEYNFIINGNDLSYKMEFSNDEIIGEEMYYVLDKKKTEYFKINKNEIRLNEKVFIDTYFRNDLLQKIKRLHGKHTFLAILNNELQKNNHSYVRNRLIRKFIDIYNELSRCQVWCKYTDLEEGTLEVRKIVLSKLDEGIINQNELNKMLKTQNALSIYFSSLFKDIKNVEYDYKLDKGKISYKLFFNKIVNNEIIKVPYDLESTGIMKILRLFHYLYGFFQKNLVFIDEIDSGIHDLLMSDIIVSMEKQGNGQLIITTHNTHLMNKVDPDSVYVLNKDNNGITEIKSVPNIRRIQNNNNVSKLYLKGEFNGIPRAINLNFTDIHNELQKK